MPPLKGLDGFSTLPSTPPAAACWAKLSRAYGAGFSASELRRQTPTLVEHQPETGASGSLFQDRASNSPLLPHEYAYRLAPATTFLIRWFVMSPHSVQADEV